MVLNMKLEIKNISKSFGCHQVLNQVSLSLEPGVYALLGPNGSGKSTLMNILTDNILPDNGDVLFHHNDTTVSIRSNTAAFLDHIGYMPQDAKLYSEFTIAEFCKYIAILKNVPKKETDSFISETLHSLELDDIKNKKIMTLSGGMKQRLSLAQAVTGSPDILLLDEPTAGLDPKQRISIRNFISKIALSKIVIYATHVVSDIEFIARDIIMLKKGVVVDNALPHELTKKIGGIVWNVPCSESEVQLMQDKFRVTNIARDEDTGKVLLRVLADEQPTNQSQTVAPTLEDYYLYVFGETSSAS